MRKFKNLIIFVGCPGSGKTTLTERIISEFSGYGISTDRIKEAVFREDIMDLEILFEIQYFIIEKLMKTGKLLVSDANSAKKWQRNKLKKLAKLKGYKTKVIYLYADRSILEERLILRLSTNEINKKAINILDKSLQELEIPNDALRINTELNIENNLDRIRAWIND
ncbi:AAA family ATPase [Helcococcus ovis]|uniref:AAA family ATPase n=1 Tax=Helcococcus ovis TaxID=72026 RepID=UPI0038BAF053